AKPPIVTNLGNKYLCAGDCYAVGGTMFCQPGQYAEVLESYLGCDSIVNFNLQVANPVAEISGGGTLSCTAPSITLRSAASAGTKAWTNASGQVVGTGSTFVVSTPGVYTLTVTQTLGPIICTKTANIVVLLDNVPPVVTAQGGILTCDQPAISLSGS